MRHSVVVVRDLEASLRFYRDGLGLDLLADRQVEGDWPELLGAPSRRLRAVFLGNTRVPDDRPACWSSTCSTATSRRGPPPGATGRGFFLLSFFADVEPTLGRLAWLGLGGEPRRVTQPTPGGPICLATSRDPDGVWLALAPGSITRRD